MKVYTEKPSAHLSFTDHRFLVLVKDNSIYTYCHDTKHFVCIFDSKITISVPTREWDSEKDGILYSFPNKQAIYAYISRGKCLDEFLVHHPTTHLFQNAKYGVYFYNSTVNKLYKLVFSSQIWGERGSYHNMEENMAWLSKLDGLHAGWGYRTNPLDYFLERSMTCYIPETLEELTELLRDKHI